MTHTFMVHNDEYFETGFFCFLFCSHDNVFKPLFNFFKNANILNGVTSLLNMEHGLRLFYNLYNTELFGGALFWPKYNAKRQHT